MVRAATKAAEIAKQMTLGKTAVEKLGDIEGDDKRVEAVENLANTRMAAISVMYVNTFRVHIAKENLQLDCIVVLNASDFLKNSAMV